MSELKLTEDEHTHTMIIHINTRQLLLFWIVFVFVIVPWCLFSSSLLLLEPEFIQTLTILGGGGGGVVCGNAVFSFAEGESWSACFDVASHGVNIFSWILSETRT